MQNTVESPITGLKNVDRESEISSNFLIDGYKKFLNINVSPYFQNIETIGIYRCVDTGYGFYFPFAEGDGKFYESLQRYPWYYMDWKWENAKTAALIKPGNKILEVGFGNGGFLTHLKKLGISGEGIELNRDAVAKAQANGLKVYSASLEDFSLSHARMYDLVCSFQVLEHIAQAGKALKNMTELLRPSGTLVVSVPNNKCFIKDDPNAILNMPPHHMGLWDEHSLSKAAKYFGLSFEKAYFEPLQPYHFRYFYQVKVGYAIERRLGFVGKVFNKVVSTLLYPFMFLPARYIKGHTILVVYRKN